MATIFSDFMKTKCTDPRSSINPKQKNHKKMAPKRIKINLLKTNGIEKILKAAREKRQIVCGTKISIIADLNRNHASQKTIEQRL